MFSTLNDAFARSIGNTFPVPPQSLDSDDMVYEQPEPSELTQSVVACNVVYVLQPARQKKMI
eukprot:m.78045 g.78045  ORF g.78045 m.78045 type:complete len:62 (-) comp25072_c0_seq1:105-290(-)